MLEFTGEAKASSASASVTRWLISLGFEAADGCDFGSNANLFPDSCRIENWSRGGKRVEISSSSLLSGRRFDGASKAAKGSLLMTRIGDGLGRAAGCFAEESVGLPRLIGVMSGMFSFSSTGAVL